MFEAKVVVSEVELPAILVNVNDEGVDRVTGCTIKSKVFDVTLKPLLSVIFTAIVLVPTSVAGPLIPPIEVSDIPPGSVPTIE